MSPAQQKCGMWPSSTFARLWGPGARRTPATVVVVAQVILNRSSSIGSTNSILFAAPHAPLRARSAGSWANPGHIGAYIAYTPASAGGFVRAPGPTRTGGTLTGACWPTAPPTCHGILLLVRTATDRCHGPDQESVSAFKTDFQTFISACPSSPCILSRTSGSGTARYDTLNELYLRLNATCLLSSSSGSTPGSCPCELVSTASRSGP